jgi:hypothetical protein
MLDRGNDPDNGGLRLMAGSNVHNTFFLKDPLTSHTKLVLT